MGKFQESSQNAKKGSKKFTLLLQKMVSTNSTHFHWDAEGKTIIIDSLK